MKMYDTKSTTCCLLFVVEDGLKQIACLKNLDGVDSVIENIATSNNNLLPNTC